MFKIKKTNLSWLIKVIYLVRQARLISNPVDIETNDFENWWSLQAVEPIVHSRLENQ